VIGLRGSPAICFDGGCLVERRPIHQRIADTACLR